MFFSFKSFVNSHHPKEILTLDEFFKLREEVLAKKSDSSAEEEDGSDEQPPGEEAPPGVESEGGKVMNKSYLINLIIFTKKEEITLDLCQF